MKLTIFGGTSGAGRAFITQALALGHTITALVRVPGKLEMAHSNLRLVQGDVRNSADVDAAVAGSEAVISLLGAKPKDDADLCSKATRHIIASMHAHGVKRLVCITGCMVGHPPELMHGMIYTLMRWLEVGFLKRMMVDRRTQEALIMNSGLDWTIIRPPRLTDGPRAETYRVGSDLIIGPGAKISRADLGNAILRAIIEGSHIREGVAISMS